MKVKLLFLVVLMACPVWYGCKDDSEIDVLDVSASSFTDIGSDSHTLNVDITCTGAWTASSNAGWCTISPQAGVENQTITIELTENLLSRPREAIVTVSSNGMNREIPISQKAPDAPADFETYHYRLPVIFHVLYQDKNDTMQYIKEGRLPELLVEVNELYRHAGANSVDMNLEFVLATESPSGEILAEPGVERIEWSTSIVMDYEDFMSRNDRKYNYLLWEPNDYINVMIYTFTNEEVLGVSALPYTPDAYPLDGLENVSLHLTGKNLAYAHCISINNTGGIYDDPLYWDEPAVTLAHELGHYLGLYHVFFEASQDGVEICEDTDYCDDTPTYDRTEYMNWMNNLSPDDGSYTYDFFCQRYDCVRGISYKSHNIMDYDCTYMDQFTQDQKARTRHVLTYSPLIPGPKKDWASTRATPDGVVDLPIRIME